MSDHFDSLSVSELTVLFDKLRAALPAENAEALALEAHGATELMGGCRQIYVMLAADPRTASDIADDCRRAWSGRTSDRAGRIEVAKALDAHFIQEKTSALVRIIAKALDSLGVGPTDIGGETSEAVDFGGKTVKKKQMVARLMSFWEAAVPPSTWSGFRGRAYQLDVSERRGSFCSVWKSSDLDELEAEELRELCAFLFDDGPSSPSGGAAKRRLTRLLSGGIQADELKKDKSAVRSMSTDKGNKACDSSTTSVPFKATAAVSPVRADRQNEKRSKQKDKPVGQVSGASDSSGSSSDLQGPSEDAAGEPEANLPRKMKQILWQGGKKFAAFYETLRDDVTTPADLHELLRYYKAGKKVATAICRGNGFDLVAQKSIERLVPTPLFFVLPDERKNPQLAFRPTKRIAPQRLQGWIKDGSVMTFVESLAARVADKGGADAHLHKEILSHGLTLAALLDEVHPEHFIYSVAIERLVRRLVVLEQAIGKDAKERAAHFEKMMAFMGLSGDPNLN